MSWGVKYTGEIKRITVSQLLTEKEQCEDIIEFSKLEFFSLVAATPTNGVDDDGNFFYSTDLVIEKADMLWTAITENIARLALINQAINDKNAKNV